MRHFSTKLAAPLALLSLTAAAGCRDGSRDAAAGDALQRDLELAQASAVALAPTTRGLPPTRFVSAIEAGERPTAETSAAARPARRAPRKAPTVRVEPAPPAPAPVVTETVAETTVAEEPQTAPEPAPEPTVTTVADAGPAPAETPTSGPSDEGVITVAPPTDEQGASGGEGRRRRGRGIGGIIGGVIGVVIRGGSVGGIDHCERDRPGARGGGIPYPVGGRMGGGTVATGGWGGGGSVVNLPASGIGRVARPRY